MITLICAMDQNRGIGLNGKMPWHFPEDLKHFRNLTLHQTVLMGKKTYESIGHPLADRHNVILTHDPYYHAEGCTIIHSMEEALQFNTDLWIIGGSTLYRQFLPYADKLYLTEIHEIFPADTFFPEFNPSHYTKTLLFQTTSPYKADFVLYEK